jgi:hypothetical protein
MSSEKLYIKPHVLTSQKESCNDFGLTIKQPLLGNGSVAITWLLPIAQQQVNGAFYAVCAEM